ncbi:MAG: LysE/ArgO family amino acid transporter [Pseudomonadota bacterium]
MLSFFLQGFLLGLAYVAPIGMQNMYVINTAVRSNRLRAYQVAFITIFFDISLALACFMGIGLILQNVPVLKYFIMGVGSLAVIYIGIGLVRSAPSIKSDMDINQTLVKVAWMCFAVTWLNPQAIIDGSLLLGGYRASLPGTGSGLFIAGVAFASFTWFTSITTAIVTFRKIMNEKILKYINVACGSIIVIYGIKLGFSLLSMIR